ncbi:MAG: DUF5005 domain-containing protein [Planctomycetota bacterium]|nr:DUF5005 domain-containing protein [Planctomycetota bacterium]
MKSNRVLTLLAITGLLVLEGRDSLQAQKKLTPGELPGKPMPEWDRIFSRKKGWTGADGCYSVELGAGRTLWLYSDTWVGTVAEGKHAKGSQLVNNSIGLQPSIAQGKPPKHDSLEFFWGKPGKDSKARAWIEPDLPLKADDPQAADKSWYWLLDGCMITPPGGGKKLLVFLMHMGRKKEGGDGVFNFRMLGGALAVISNPQDDPSQWKISQAVNPHSRRKGTDDISWATALYHSGNAGPGEPGMLYIYGIRDVKGLNKQVVLARAPTAQADDFSTWRFFTGKGWSEKSADSVKITDQAVNEHTVESISYKGKHRLVLVESQPVFGRHVLVRTAAKPEGPWSEFRKVFLVTNLEKGKHKRFTYAGKGHAHLSAPGELLISYVINSHDFWDMVGDASIYRPRFIRVPLQAVFD